MRWTCAGWHAACRPAGADLHAVAQQFWYRSTKFVMRRAIPIGLPVVALLVLVGTPFLGLRPSFPDDRVLPIPRRLTRSAIVT